MCIHLEYRITCGLNEPFYVVSGINIEYCSFLI